MNIALIVLILGVIINAISTILWIITVFSISILLGIYFYLGIPLIATGMAMSPFGRSEIMLPFITIFPLLNGLLFLYIVIIRNWQKAQKPFFLGILGTILCLAGAIMGITLPSGQTVSFGDLVQHAKSQNSSHTPVSAQLSNNTAQGRFTRQAVPTSKTIHLDPEGFLKQAVQNGDFAEAENLLKHGGNPNMKSVMGNTLLMEAVSYGYQDLVKLLISFGADLEAVNKNGQTALQLAEMNYRNNIAEILREALENRIEEN